MMEQQLEHLNFYNGQRLDARDLRLEQDFHIRIRRWLNRSLHGPGIVAGLQVRPQGVGSQHVVVSPGMALDSAGREIILLDEQSVPVVGTPSAVVGDVRGNYLTIEYHELKLAEQMDGCDLPARALGPRAVTNAAWGGPSRVRLTPILGWSDVLPIDTSGRVVLAQVELDDTCAVRHVYSMPRRYVRTTSESRVRQYALEGYRDIDKDNPGIIRFHVRGPQTAAVTLYLRSEKLSTLYYTEMGHHNHTATIDTGSGTGNAGPASVRDRHQHDITNLPSQAENPNPHTHSLSAFVSNKPDFQFNLADPFSTLASAFRSLVGYPKGPPAPVYMLRLITRIGGNLESLNSNGGDGDVGATIGGGSHSHASSGPTGATANPPADNPGETLHVHPIVSTISGSGVSDIAARGTDSAPQTALTFVRDLHVAINGHDYTANVKEQLHASQPLDTWDPLGTGAGADDYHDALAYKGTGAIKLDFLSPGLSFSQGEYWIDLTVASGGSGGRVHFNLYVE